MTEKMVKRFNSRILGTPAVGMSTVEQTMAAAAKQANDILAGD